MNTITINEKVYTLPKEPQQLNMTLNHIGIVQNNKADYVKLYDIDGKEHKLNGFLLNNAKIVTVIGGEEFVYTSTQRQITILLSLAKIFEEEFDLDEKDVKEVLNDYIKNLR